jgi:hypothetical protein
VDDQRDQSVEDENARQADDRPDNPIAYNRTWAWRDGLGCFWLPGLLVILSIAVWLGAVGVPALLLQLGTVAAMIGLLIAFWRISRSGDKA